MGIFKKKFEDLKGNKQMALAENVLKLRLTRRISGWYLRNNRHNGVYPNVSGNMLGKT